MIMEQGNYGYSTEGQTENLRAERVGRKPATHRKYTKEFKDEIIRLKKEEKLPRKEIADRLGITLKAVEHILYDNPILLTGSKGRELTDKQLSWLKRHYQHTRNDDIQVKLNISFSSLHRIAREHGLKKSKRYMKAVQAEATRKAKESHERNGTYPPKGHIVPNSEKTRLKKGIGMKDRMTRWQMKKASAKGNEKRNETIARERRRILYGFEQQTKMRLVREPRSKGMLRCNMKKRGYLVKEKGANVLYITPDTRRSPICEQHAIEMGFTIIPENA